MRFKGVSKGSLRGVKGKGIEIVRGVKGRVREVRGDKGR